MVTAELAVGILSVVVVLAFLLFAIGVGIAHLRTQEASRAGARAAARGDSATEPPLGPSGTDDRPHCWANRRRWNSPSQRRLVASS